MLTLHKPFIRMIKKYVFDHFYSVFYHFQPCKRMRKHAFAGQNTQQTKLQKMISRSKTGR